MRHIFTALMLFFATALHLSSSPGIDLYNQGRLHEAKQTLEQSVRTETAGVEEMAVLGMTYTRLAMYTKAKRILTEALQLAPEDPQVLTALAMLEFATGEYETAYSWLGRSRSGRGSSAQGKQPLVDSLINRSVRLYQQGELPQAAEALAEARRLDSDNAMIIAMLIQLHRELEQPDELIDLYRRFVELQPENAQAYTELGILLDQSGRSAEAEGAFLQAEHYNTEEPYPYYFLARSAVARQHRAADQRVRIHLAIGKAVRKIAMLRVQAAGTFQQQQGQLSAEELEELQELTGRTERPKQILQASLALLKGSFTLPQEYEQDLRRLIEWYPHSLELRCALGRLLEEQRRPEEARQHWRALLADFPTAMEAHTGLARSLQALGRQEEARIAYLRARDLDPENPEIYHALQQLFSAEGLEKELLQLYRDIYERERTNIALIYARAEIEAQLGLSEQAAAHRLRAAELEQRQDEE